VELTVKDLKVFIVIVEDRHCDVLAYPFFDKDAAINEAKRIAKQYASNDFYEEHDYGRGEGWLFYANYSVEGDCVRVIETNVK
jgi:hypothetical protein